MKTSKLIRVLITGGLILVSVYSFAAGLGRLTVQSALGQPLQAEIELLSVQKGDIDSLAARVASQEAFQEAKVNYAPILSTIRLSVEKRPDGQPYLRLTSSQPVNEPFIDMLVELTWASGRLVREFPLLLDPPGFAAKQPAPAIAAPVPAPRLAEPDKAATTRPATPAAAAEPKAVAGASTADSYTVKSGDTLYRIANEMKPAGVDVDRMVVALFRENRQAFMANNMNRLKSGAILRVPSAEQASTISAQEATRDIRVQVADWNAYRSKLAGQVAAAPSQSDIATQSAAGKIAKASVDQPAPASTASKDVLKLSKSAEGKSVTDKGAEAKTNALREELIARENQVKEEKVRVAQLEKNIQEMQQLLALKNQTLAELQKQVEAGKVAQTAPAGKAADVKPAAAKPEAKPAETKSAEKTKSAEPKSSETKVADTKTADTKTADTKTAETKLAEAKPTEAKSAEAKPAEPKSATDTKAAAEVAPAQVAIPPAQPEPSVEKKPAEAKPKAAAKQPPPVEPEPSVMDQLLDYPLLLSAGAGIALFAAGFIGYSAYRRRKTEAVPTTESTSSLVTDLKSGALPNAKSSGVVDTGNSSFLTDFEKTGPGIIDIEEVDPVAEAEVYIAYGRDAQAEEILKEAMAKDSSRHEIPMKLLEIYLARKSAASFEAVAQDLHRSIGSHHPIWNRVAEMGRKLDPSNPLYAVNDAVEEEQSSSASQAFRDEPKVPQIEEDSAAPSKFSAPGLDLSLEEVPESGRRTQRNASSFERDALDFEFDGDPTPPPATSRPEPPASEQTQLRRPKFPGQFNDDDLDLSEFDAGTMPAPAAPNATEARSDKPLPTPAQTSPNPIIPTAIDTAAKRPASPVDLNSLNLDLSPGSSPAEVQAQGDANGEWHSVATKLDLARAYLEIGDKDGAREILQEVIQEGDVEQKREAEALAATL